MVLNTYKTGSGLERETSVSLPLASTAFTFWRSTGEEPYFAMKSIRRAMPVLVSAEVQNNGMNDCLCTAA